MTKKISSNFSSNSLSSGENATIDPKKQSECMVSGLYKLSRLAEPLAIIIVSIILYSSIFDQKIDLNGDNIAYIHLAKSLAAGKGFVDFWDKAQKPANHFPPGYPFFISLILRILPDNIMAIKICNGIFLVSSMLLLWFLLNKCTEKKHLVWTSLLFCIMNTYLLRFATIEMSEIPFLFFSLCAILLFLNRDSARPFFKDPMFFLCLVAMATCFYIRTAGLALIAGVCLYLLVRKKWMELLAYCVGLFILVSPWFIRGLFIGGNAYVNSLLVINVYRPELGKAGFSDLLSRFVENLVRYINVEIPNGLFPFIKPLYDTTTATTWLTGILIICILIYGLYRLPSYRSFFFLYLCGTFAILLLWPSVWNGVRFLLPSVPILLFIFWNGIDNGIKKICERLTLHKSVSPLLFAIVVIFFAILQIAPIKQLQKIAASGYSPEYKAYFQLAQWARENTDSTAVFCCRKPELFSFFAHRYTNIYLFSLDDKEIISDMRLKQISYVVLDQLGFSSTPRYLYPAIVKNQSLFTIVAQVPNTQTYLLKLQ